MRKTSTGGLGQASLDDPDEDWSPYAISREEFQWVWTSPDS